MRRPSFREQDALEAKAVKRSKQDAVMTQKNAGPSVIRTLNRSAFRDVSESRDSPTTAAPSVPRPLTSGSPVTMTLVDAALKVVCGVVESRSKGKTVDCDGDNTATHDKEQATGCAIDGIANQSKGKAMGLDKMTAEDASGSKRLPPYVANSTTDAKIPTKQCIAPHLPHSSKIVSLSLTPGAFHDNATAAATFFSGITLPAEHLPSPSTLSRSGSYADMSLHGAKLTLNLF